MSLQDDELRAKAERESSKAQRSIRRQKRKNIPKDTRFEAPKDTPQGEANKKGILDIPPKPDLLKMFSIEQSDNTGVKNPMTQQAEDEAKNKVEPIEEREVKPPVKEYKGTLENNEYMAEQKKLYDEESKKTAIQKIAEDSLKDIGTYRSEPIASRTIENNIKDQKIIHTVGSDGKIKAIPNPDYVEKPLTQGAINEVTAQTQVEWDDKGKLTFPNKPEANLQQKVEAGVTNTLMKAGLDPTSSMGLTLKNVLTPIYTGMSQMERGNKEGFVRDMADKILGLVSIGIGTMPEMIGANALTDLTSMIAMEIGDEVGLPKQSSEKLGHVISLAPFGKTIVIAGLMSSTAGEFVADILKDKSMDETDKERLVEFAGHIGFFGSIGAMNVSKGVYKSIKYKYAKEDLSDPLIKAKIDKDLEDQSLIEGLRTDKSLIKKEYWNADVAGTLAPEQRIKYVETLSKYDKLIADKEEGIKLRDEETKVAYEKRESEKPTFEKKQTESNLEKYQAEKKVYDEKIRDYEGDKNSADFQALKTLQSSTDKAIANEKKNPTPLRTEKDRAEAFGKAVTEFVTKDMTGGLDVKTQGFGGKKKDDKKQTDVISKRDRSEEERKAGKELAKEKIKDPTKNVSLQTANKYNKSVGLPEVTQHEYKPSDKEIQSKIAELYPKLQDVNSKDYKETDLERKIYSEYKEKFPDVVEQSGAKDYKGLVKEAYAQLIKETDEQYKALPIKITYHEGDKNYENSAEMLDDVHNFNHMWVYKGGDDHTELGSKTMDKEGLTANEKFRAVHDYFGHSVEGYQFGKHGEENAWIEHSKMFSPLAQWALSSETRGQNSYVNYSGVNEGALKKIQSGNKLKREGKVKEGQALIDEANQEFKYAEQKAMLLPPSDVAYENYHSTQVREIPKKLQSKQVDKPSAEQSPRETKQIVKDIKAKGHEHITPVELLKDEKLYNDMREVGQSVFDNGKTSYRNWREGMRKVLKTDNITMSRVGRLLFDDIKSGKRSKMMELTHFTSRTSDPEILILDPKKFTTDSRSYTEGDKRMSGVPRTFWTTDDKSVAEKNLYGDGTVYKAGVDPNKIYDLKNDPEGYVKKYGNNIDGLLKRLKKEGYEGTYDQRVENDKYDNNLNVVMTFGKQKAERPPENSVTITKAQNQLRDYQKWKKLIKEGKTYEAEVLSKQINKDVGEDFKKDVEKNTTGIYDLNSFLELGISL